jgi:adenylosuccinate synthase
MSNVVILGTQWGDEGKGKIVDVLAQGTQFGAVIRYQGGDNAGHTVVVGGERHAFHLLPSGILYPDKICVIGNGVIVNPQVLLDEVTQLEASVGQDHARLLISKKVHLIMPWHVIRDRIAGGTIGTTGRGIGPTYVDAVDRRGIRWLDTQDKSLLSHRISEELAWNRHLIEAMLDHRGIGGSEREALGLEELLNEKRITNDYVQYVELIRQNPLIDEGDVSAVLDEMRRQNVGLLFEGAQATLLDVAHGTYPFVTSSHPTVGGVFVGTGFRPRDLQVVGVAKAYTTRVGAGPFPTELSDETGARLREVGNEYGVTTGRPRRCGWLDMGPIRYAKTINGLDALAVTKLDVLTGIHPLQIGVSYRVGGETAETLPVSLEDLTAARVSCEEMPGWDADITQAKRFDDLPQAAQEYVALMEDLSGLPVTMISVGPERSQLIARS